MRRCSLESQHGLAGETLSHKVGDEAGMVLPAQDNVGARLKSPRGGQAKQEGKKDDIIEKMLEGRVRKFYEEVCLLEQVFVIDNETKISKLLENAAKDVGAPVNLIGFFRIQLGEGIEKEVTDFAAEVAAAVNG